MPIDQVFYSRRRLKLNLVEATGVSPHARMGRDCHDNPGERRG